MDKLNIVIGISFLVLLTGCFLSPDKYDVQVKITKAWAYGSRVVLEFDANSHPDNTGDPIQSPHLLSALSLDTYHLLKMDKSSLVINQSVPSGLATVDTLHIDKTVDLGHVYVKGYIADEERDPTDTHFTFSPDQLASVPVLGPFVLVIPHRKAATTVSVGRLESSSGTVSFLYGIPQQTGRYSGISHTADFYGDSYAFLTEYFAPDFSDQTVYVEKWAVNPTDSVFAGGQGTYVTAGGTSATLVPYDGTTTFAPGQVVTVDNASYDLGQIPLDQ